MLNEKLIESALALTSKTMEDMWNSIDNDGDGRITDDSFSIEKFSYYLLSLEFIEKYYPIAKAYLEQKYFSIDYNTEEKNKPVYFLDISKAFGEAIYEYQKGNEERLTNLLSKIG